MELIYVKTDKNGTKIFQDWTCDRCGGAGQAEIWQYTGKTCFKCGGTGKLPKPKIVKVYTPEYKKILEAKENARREKKLSGLKESSYAPALKRNGFGADGVGFAYTGKTFEIKEELKLNGARYSFGLGWVSPKPIFGNPCIEIHADEVFTFFDMHGWDLDNIKCDAWREIHGAKR